MVNPLFDTNILVDYLRAIALAQIEFQRYLARAISIVSWMEVVAGARPENERATRSFLATFNVLAFDDRVAERAVTLRQEKRVKLPDAIIWATAQVHSLLLVSRNTKDCPADDPGVRPPYVL